ncbi:MAG: flagellar hook-associated protein FlgK [Gemmatimonadales bacterium]|nr:flagellar hook-associated protein FlgK [Gemmatimonadales bacterium]
MPGLNSIMDTSLSGLFAAQAGLATTGHNIANANTPGYSRQMVKFSSRRPDVLPFGAIGRGVDILGVRRIQDEFLLNNLRSQSSRLASYTEVDTALYEVESILGSVDNDYLGTALNDYFKAWGELANPPITDGLKDNVFEKAQTLVSGFHAINDSLLDLEANIETSIQAEITNLNRLLTAVADMNSQIMKAETNGQPANDLRDQRDLLITMVSEIAEVSVLERGDGTKDIILAGRTMVARESVTLFQSSYQASDDGVEMVILTQDTFQEVRLSRGKLEGLLTSRDVHIKKAREQLDNVAAKLITEVNALHVQGRTSSSSGMGFFTGDSMHTIGINPAIADNHTLIVTGRTDAPGDVDIAMAIADLANVGLGGPSDQSVGDVYREMLISVASKRNSFEFAVENQQNVVASLQTKIASVSGVSLDEEASQMVRYQNSYNAAAKVISTVQEMYNTLLQMI